MSYLDQCECRESFKDGKHTYTFVGPCVVTGKQQSVTVLGPDLYKYRQGAFIQDAFPYLTADQREFLMSGMSADGWDLAFEETDDGGEESA